MKKVIKINEKNYQVSISEKNMKMGIIPSFSVPSGTDFYCNQNCKGCYAKKGEKFRSCIREANMNNYIFLEELKKIKTSLCDIDLNYRIYNDVLVDFGKMINKLNCRIFRFNVYGDADNFYFKFILDLCQNYYCKDVKFYVYTKNYNVIGAHINDILTTNNLIVNVSIMHYKYSYLLNRFKGIDNINFFYTFKNGIEIDILENSYNIKFNECLNDNDKNTTCIECGYCFNKGYNVCNKYRNLSVRKLERSVYRIQNEKLDYYLKVFEKIEDSNFFTSATFSISNKVYNSLINNSKYSRYYNIRRVVFSQCNLICNYYISNK